MAEDDERELTDKEMSIVEHLGELRSRIVKSLVAVAVFSIASYFFSEQVVDYLSQPAGELVFLSPTEAFITYIKVSILMGLLIALPFVIYQFWKFVLPALKAREKKFFYILMPTSLVLFYAGVLFGFFIVLPLGLNFLLNFGSPELEAMISLDRYVSFLLTLLIPFGLIFQMPLILNLMIKMGLVKRKTLASMRRYVIVLIFIVGAILTPPDIITQAFLAGPLILLFEGSLLVARLIN